MTGPDCSRHQDLVRRLARGELDLQQAATAEEVRRDCPVCAAWWADRLESWAVQPVALGTAAGLRVFRAPEGHRARVRHNSLMAAAALAVAVGGGLLLQGTVRREPRPAERVTQTAGTNPGAAPSSDAGLVSRLRFEADGSPPIFVDGFESGDLNTWHRGRENGNPPAVARR